MKLNNIYVHVRVLSVGEVDTQVMPFHKSCVCVICTIDISVV